MEVPDGVSILGIHCQNGIHLRHEDLPQAHDQIAGRGDRRFSDGSRPQFSAGRSVQRQNTVTVLQVHHAILEGWSTKEKAHLVRLSWNVPTQRKALRLSIPQPSRASKTHWKCVN